jgi:hypothetical protein
MTYVPGNFWRCCDVCGFNYRASETTKRWDGLIVCREDYEPRHPQDFVRGRKDVQAIPNPRPEMDVFIGPTEALTTEVGEPYRIQTESGLYIMVET